MAGIPTYDTVDHIGITVPDLEAAVAFFTDVLGAELWYREGPSEDPDGDEMWRELRVHPRASVRLADAPLRLERHRGAARVPRSAR